MNLFEKIFQRNDKFFLQLYFLTIGIFLYLCSATSYYLRTGTYGLSDLYSTATILIIIIFWISVLIKTSDNRYVVGTVQFLRVEFILLIQTFLISILLAALFKVTDNYSRAWVVSSFVLSFFCLIILKVIFDQFYLYLITSNIIQRNILLVGDASNCTNIIKKFPKKKSNSVIKCLIVIDSEEKDKNFYDVPTFYLKDDLNYILSHHSIGQIWIVSSIKTQPYVEHLIDKLLNFSIDCRLISPESKFKFTEGLDSEAGFDFYNISFSPFYGTNLLIKNLLDKLFSTIFLIISLPIIIVAAILLLIEDGFPIFYKQKRTGWDGKSFTIYKLRTLIKNSEQTSSKDGPVSPIKARDTRLLTVGKILRRFSMDELPQFYNIIRGDMSIVGPRPHPLGTTKYYSKDIINFMQRHKCPPGLTGWAQVNGLRGSSNQEAIMDKRFQYDLYYIKNWNLIFDFYIIIRTVFVILFSKVN